MKTLALCGKFIDRIEEVSYNFRDDFYDWKGSGQKYNLQYRNDANNCMNVRAEAIVELPVMHLIAILYEDEYYIDWVRS